MRLIALTVLFWVLGQHACWAAGRPSASVERRYACPECGVRKVGVVAHLGFPPDGYEDTIVLKTIDCAECSFRGVAAYTSNNHGRDTSWRHYGFRITQATYDAVLKEMRACPEPGDTHCRCAAHEKYGEVEGYTWNGIHVVPHFGPAFDVR